MRVPCEITVEIATYSNDTGVDGLAMIREGTENNPAPGDAVEDAMDRRRRDPSTSGELSLVKKIEDSEGQCEVPEKPTKSSEAGTPLGNGSLNPQPVTGVFHYKAIEYSTRTE